MKRKLVVYLAGLLTVLGLGFGQAQFSDVPAGHWAKEAVERIAACGLITGFPDGTFRGNQNLTRYQAALIFQRLLNEIQQGGECVRGSGQGGLSEEDLTVIRNAVQELAAELAALGVRVSALEDNAATKDDIARLEAAIEELKAMRAQPEPAPGIDEAALADLADRVEAASVAADTALAQAQVLAERLDAVEGDVAALKTQLEADADSIRALNELAVLLNQDVLSLQDRVTALEKQLGQLSDRLGEINFDEFANREDVAAIQEFATALRADLVRLADRVSALDTRVSGLDSRLTTLEGATPRLTGGLTVRYGFRSVFTGTPGSAPGSGTNFDIDRLFPAQAFANNDGDPDLSGNSDTALQADLTFTIRRTPGTDRGFNFAEASAALRFFNEGSVFSRDGADNDLRLQSFSVSGNFDGQPFSARYSRSNTFRLTEYLLNNGTDAAGRGALVTFNATKALLSPNFTIVLGSIDGSGAAIGDYFGLRGQVDLLGLKVGVSYAEYNRLAADGVVTAPAELGDDGRAIAGIDFSGRLLGFLDLKGEAINSNRVGPNTADTLFYIQPGFSLGPISLRGNYRAIDPDFRTGRWETTDAATLSDSPVAGLSRNDTDRIFDPANAGTGFGVIAGVDLGFIRLNGYFDSKSDFFTLANPTTAFGVGATLGPLAGFSLTPYFNSVEVGGQRRFSVGNPYSNQGPATRAPFRSNFGARLAHDGAASGALISGLNLAFEFRSSTGVNPGFGNSDGNRTDLVGEASLRLPLGPISIEPNFRFHRYTRADTTPGTELDYSTLKFGVQVSTQPLFLGISLNGAFAQRNTNFEGKAPNQLDASEQFFRVGLDLADFLLPGATLSVGAAQFTGTGVVGTAGATTFNFTNRVDNFVFNTTDDRLYNGPSSSFGPMLPVTAPAGNANGAGGIRGIQVRYTYGSLGIWYGIFDFDTNDTTFNTIETVGRAFRIFYIVSF
ncbi:MAG: S-layer homology domain-containing protein [Meiothermus sp.]|uniref:S-layer homology domain-containing protein n=2 Tax=Meiothermus sp. TaxID=1955249 RepID=UPI00298F23A2|nr:S-layer homology domain-containing protein [Meiothermus sp.]MDW8481805.1 S-layer homology domain-containing protein [Meiothermus sp.]